MQKYDHLKIEKKWQKEWARKKVYTSHEDPKKPKHYVLDMFPYPSGDGLHVGHPKGYIATDIYSRFMQMKGYNILHPMGWDAFGLPAENYAIKNKIHPEIAVKKNIKRFKEQLSIMGFNYDWTREINTTDPKYYKWTQWIFLELFKKGLAYESYEPINWCPSCQTGLANEDLEDGKCERCGSVVEKRPMRQWILKITDYAERLLADLDAPVQKEPLKILIGTRNNAKVEMWRRCVPKESGITLLSLDDIAKIDDSDLVEGDDFEENARKKSEYYFKKTGIPTLSSDHIFWMEKWPENDGNVVHMRKHANPNSPRASDEEVVKYLKDFVKKNGESKSRFLYALSFTDASGTENLVAKGKEYILQDQQSKTFWDGYPVESLIKDPQTGEYKSEESDEIRYSHVIDAVQKKILPRIQKGQRTAGLNWPESIKESQRNWIGKSEGMLFTAPVKDTKLTIQTFSAHFEAFTADTFVVIAPDHPYLPKLLEGIPNKKEILDFAAGLIKKRAGQGFAEEKESEGIFTGRYIVDPVGNGDLPIWIASFALADYGTGIVKCSVHDERDFAFAKKYKIRLKPVLFPADKVLAEKVRNLEVCFSDMKNGVLNEPKAFEGKFSGKERQNIISYLEKNKLAVKKTTYRLRDWVFSRQRYWGEPIPIIHCEKCGTVPVPEKDLPVKLPKVKSYAPTGTGESPLAEISKWVNVKCPKCYGPAKRETNTMPQWAGSSWYYLRYMDPKNSKTFVDPKKEKYWAPVDVYVGGTEHATRHLIYARFWHKFLFDIGAVSTTEPFMRLKNQGLILAEDGKKMSKRFGNVINPDDIIKLYGADTLRIYEMFMGPFENAINWSTESMIGSRRFVERVWKLSQKVAQKPKTAPSQNLLNSLHKTIKKVGEDIVDFKFNTAISSMMMFLNEAEKETEIGAEIFSDFLKILSPFAPHVTQELWSLFGKGELKDAQWPVFDSALIGTSSFTIVVQVNGKVRGEFRVESEMGEEETKKRALSLPETLKWMEGKTAKKIIYVKNKLVSIVV
ncbi:MAG: leucine--tRNA ligase [Candidatus Pacebacteria bacterium]|nr:leucine--tRNA ligase [Candidatus Paceibacterota bacterium]MDD5357184.1 leucine--tRNA ligase [Candidatus Paceibacterota bacterium]